MRLLAIAFTAVLSGCCTYISREDAIQIAKGELGRRNLRLPHRYTVEATRSTIITESGPDIPVYVVSFNIPRGGKQTPFYDLDLDPCNGSVRTVRDFRKSSVFRIGEGGVIEQKKGNKWVPVKAAKADSHRPER
jgi:hypothetical protein